MCVVSFFFFKQKTAYEGRISDWRSDVCSSDLSRGPLGLTPSARTGPASRFDWPTGPPSGVSRSRGSSTGLGTSHRIMRSTSSTLDRKSGVSGKGVSGRVELGGGRSIHKAQRVSTMMKRTDSYLNTQINE